MLCWSLRRHLESDNVILRGSCGSSHRRAVRSHGSQTGAGIAHQHLLCGSARVRVASQISRSTLGKVVPSTRFKFCLRRRSFTIGPWRGRCRAVVVSRFPVEVMLVAT